MSMSQTFVCETVLRAARTVPWRVPQSLYQSTFPKPRRFHRVSLGRILANSMLLNSLDFGRFPPPGLLRVLHCLRLPGEAPDRGASVVLKSQAVLPLWQTVRMWTRPADRAASSGPCHHVSGRTVPLLRSTLSGSGSALRSRAGREDSRTGLRVANYLVPGGSSHDARAARSTECSFCFSRRSSSSGKLRQMSGWYRFSSSGLGATDRPFADASLTVRMAHPRNSLGPSLRSCPRLIAMFAISVRSSKSNRSTEIRSSPRLTRNASGMCRGCLAFLAAFLEYTLRPRFSASAKTRSRLVNGLREGQSSQCAQLGRKEIWR